MLWKRRTSPTGTFEMCLPDNQNDKRQESPAPQRAFLHPLPDYQLAVILVLITATVWICNIGLAIAIHIAKGLNP